MPVFPISLIPTIHVSDQSCSLAYVSSQLGIALNLSWLFLAMAATEVLLESERTPVEPLEGSMAMVLQAHECLAKVLLGVLFLSGLCLEELLEE